jgi:hypothetical protein
MHSMNQDFDTAFATFLQGLERVARERIAREGWDELLRFETDVGPRYIRVVWVRKDSRTVHLAESAP